MVIHDISSTHCPTPALTSYASQLDAVPHAALLKLLSFSGFDLSRPVSHSSRALSQTPKFLPDCMESIGNNFLMVVILEAEVAKGRCEFP